MLRKGQSVFSRDKCPDRLYNPRALPKTLNVIRLYIYICEVIIKEEVNCLRGSRGDMRRAGGERGGWKWCKYRTCGWNSKNKIHLKKENVKLCHSFNFSMSLNIKAINVERTVDLRIGGTLYNESVLVSRKTMSYMRTKPCLRAL